MSGAKTLMRSKADEKYYGSLGGQWSAVSKETKVDSVNEVLHKVPLTKEDGIANSSVADDDITIK